MSDWTAGYVADIGYTYGYYPELNPLRAKLALLNTGISCTEFETACELGFGQGVSANFHAAASAVHWCGTDFNPSQAAFANELTKISGAGAQLVDDAFEDYLKRQDLPDFDFIGLHGIWSWISDENRRLIVEFIRKKLKIGGVLYISYNTLPGWAAFAPMRHLMTEHAEVIGAEGRGIVSRINDAIEFADKLLETNPNFHKANPQVAERIKQLKNQNRHYLAHEYFNRDWHPMHFATMAEWLGAAKLQYACSAHYLDHMDVLNITPDQLKFLSQIPDPMFKESVRDFIVNQQFRKDYWVKGARRMTPLEQTEAIRAQRFMLTSNRDDISLKVMGAVGQSDMNEAIYKPILEILADHKVRSFAQLERELGNNKITFGQLLQSIMVLAGGNHLCAVQDDAAISKAKRKSEKLNAHLLNKARSNSELAYLCSPVTSSGHSIGRFQQLFLLAHAQGKKQANEMAQFAWALIDGQGQKIVKEGKPLDSAAENLAELNAQAELFIQKQLPIMKALQVA